MTETYTWDQVVHYKALATRVLVVARTRVDGTWKAYCNAVPGEHHSKEIQEVLDYGDQLREDVARVLFPEFKELPYAE